MEATPCPQAAVQNLVCDEAARRVSASTRMGGGFTNSGRASGLLDGGGMRATWTAVIVVLWAGVARAEAPDLTLQKDPGQVDEEVATGPPDMTPVPWGFYRDGQGRVMQVSFDLGRRVWLGVGYAPRRRSTCEREVAPAALDSDATCETLSADGLTRYRWHIMEGEARVHPFGLDMTTARF